ncbi:MULTISPECIES: MetQ/NlpA family ABC transporter substrate-binding protein [Bifidobacterium]|jgi:D-methionine transport system substrate-binding protein|uniref:ABC transporter substrate-binding protein n=1 Tax=Bifidobacterium tibiigranuli TaxID=2172043 RepID=A0A5N6S444_9BIFI|nr:MetQ/NlpA family ABC transporter substrate-binding protein [Bifidobacterium tibiigranuli]KAE8128032.1 ABC transporter substrate-binding protein [Bifidobacterium tibiigranuli]KAE8128193.1 ABC transporter substrate-binding protein [Bifidobacterium tibiigranuli]MCH3974079.1 MetQ/NlpA family ABC transporter substrate-binding protein [Bifidobacterium tibiigranuli]MCH4189109.1 MetQ/NlpA family ABC transporter substrate-binding protein [Bifidobacterium tibiigranuli]MCH4204069.1 MetQ/NlpA family AB
MTSSNQQPADTGSSQEPVRVNHTARNIIITVVVIAVLAVAVFFGYRAIAGKSDSAAKGSQSNPVKIGVVGATEPQWIAFTKKAEQENIHVKIVDFQDYTSENPALDSGDLDLNEFQHLLYLANYNVKNNKDLQPIGGTAVYPLGLYSEQVKDVKDINAGSTVAIPNDETNQARAIGVLKAAGLVKLKGAWTPFTSPADIDTATSKVAVAPLKAEQVANSLKDPKVAAGVINNDYVKDAGLNPKDAIYSDNAETVSARPYINVFVSRKADVNNATYLKLVKIFQSKEVLAALQSQSGGTAAFADKYSAQELQGFLATIEKEAKASK